MIPNDDTETGHQAGNTDDQNAGAEHVTENSDAAKGGALDPDTVAKAAADLAHHQVADVSRPAEAASLEARQAQNQDVAEHAAAVAGETEAERAERDRAWREAHHGAKLPPVAHNEHPAEPDVPLRTDGPTLAEYIAAGYPADTYPPAGYAERTEPVVAKVAEAPAAKGAREGFNDQMRGEHDAANSAAEAKGAKGEHVTENEAMGVVADGRTVHNEHGQHMPGDVVIASPEEIGRLRRLGFLDPEQPLN